MSRSDATFQFGGYSRYFSDNKTNRFNQGCHINTSDQALPKFGRKQFFLIQLRIF